MTKYLNLSLILKLSEQFTTAISNYFKLLKPKSNQKKLANILDPENFSDDSLQRGLISILLDYNGVEDKLNCMNKWLSLTLEESKFNKANKVLQEFELDKIIVKWFNTLLDTKEEVLSIETATKWVVKLKYNILTANVTKIVKEDTYTSLKIKRAADTYKLMKFFELWQQNQSTCKKIEPVFSAIGTDINTLSILKWYGTETEYQYYSEEMVDGILKTLYKEVGSNALKTKEECIRWRKEESISVYIKDQIDFLYHAASMYAILDSYNSFRFNTAENYIPLNFIRSTTITVKQYLHLIR